MPEAQSLCSAGRLPAASEGFTIASQGGVLATAGAINTKGTAAVIQATTPFDAHGCWVQLTSKSAAGDQLVDICVGGSGAEVALIPNIYYTAGSNSSYGKTYFFPVSIPGGSRLSAKVASATASVTCRVAVYLQQQSELGLPTVDRIIAFGADTAASRGTPLGDPAAASWGAWTQISASVSDHLHWLCPVFGDRAIATRTSGNKMIGQMGRGAAAAEQGIGPEIPWNCSSTSNSINRWDGWWGDIPAGERMVARYGASTATALGMDVIIYGGV